MRSGESSPRNHQGNFRGTLLILCHMTQSDLDASALRSGLASTVPRTGRGGWGPGIDAPGQLPLNLGYFGLGGWGSSTGLSDGLCGPRGPCEAGGVGD